MTPELQQMRERCAGFVERMRHEAVEAHEMEEFLSYLHERISRLEDAEDDAPSRDDTPT